LENESRWSIRHVQRGSAAKCQGDKLLADGIAEAQGDDHEAEWSEAPQSAREKIARHTHTHIYKHKHKTHAFLVLVDRFHELEEICNCLVSVDCCVPYNFVHHMTHRDGQAPGALFGSFSATCINRRQEQYGFQSEACMHTSSSSRSKEAGRRRKREEEKERGERGGGEKYKVR
jgi:hypothetical protein